MVSVLALAPGVAVAATPPVPESGHPRLFMSRVELAAYTVNAATDGTTAAALVKACQDTLDEPSDYTTRGGADGDTWPAAAIDCAFS